MFYFNILNWYLDYHKRREYILMLELNYEHDFMWLSNKACNWINICITKHRFDLLRCDFGTIIDMACSI